MEYYYCQKSKELNVYKIKYIKNKYVEQRYIYFLKTITNKIIKYLIKGLHIN